ncbi:LVIS_2131 family protein [Apilactobacillus apisilvae]|uniref:LVIS_2131 family protein n=1 Tax=Apilactobacillus apisilvae TaxID=2923364 RepID=A0ABY4PF66_9LACO|nr:LVIS_2131 family protein [Apilactobacillus apisilvae]UQS84410.1 LVIS_2131 family protein [Apilactobacillus apisilvae]
MESAWNIVGVIFWIALFIYAIFIVHNIGVRRSRIILNNNYSFSWNHFIKTILQLLILLLGVGFLIFQTFKSNIDAKDVLIKREYNPLILDTNGKESYYVSVSKQNSPKLNQSYSYLSRDKHIQVSSDNSSILVGSNNVINIPSFVFDWQKQNVNRLDKLYQKAWVVKVKTTYKNNFINGIGLHAGRQANQYTLIRIPDSSFIYKSN